MCSHLHPLLLLHLLLLRLLLHPLLLRLLLLRLLLLPLVLPPLVLLRLLLRPQEVASLNAELKDCGKDRLSLKNAQSRLQLLEDQYKWVPACLSLPGCPCLPLPVCLLRRCRCLALPQHKSKP